MVRTPSRRAFLSAAALVPAALVLASCSDSGNQAEAQTPPSSGSPAPAAPAVAAPPSEGTVDMAKLLEAGALPEKSVGDANAPVTMVEYASMTCPHCAQFHAVTYPELKTKYIDTGKVRLILREFPFDPRAEAGFMLARCSGDNYFAMVDVLFKQQRNWAAVENARGALLQISRLAGFSQESFEKCLTDQKLLDDVRSVQKRGADEFDVRSTPTFFINGNKYAGALTIAEVSAIIDPML